MLATDSNRRGLVLVTVGAALLGPLSGCGQSPHEQVADAIYAGGDIVTVDDRRPVAEALAVKDGRILAVGNAADVMKHKGSDTRVIDLDGRCLLPGFIDSHSHIMYTAVKLGEVKLDPPPAGDVTSISDIQRNLRDVLESSPPPPGKWLVGSGYDNAMLAEGRHPTRDDLDAISTEVPILLRHFSGHMLVLNSKGLAEVGINADAEAPEGGVIRRIPGTREPNGIIEETAMAPVLDIALGAGGRAASERRINLVREALRVYTSRGFTTILEAYSDSSEHLDVLRRLGQEGDLEVDVVVFPFYRSFSAKEVAAQYSSTYQKRVRIGGGKIVLDGGSPGRTAFLREPYHEQLSGEEGYRGYPSIEEQSEIDRLVTGYYEAGVPVIIHALGDASVDQAIAAVAAAEAAVPGTNRRTQLIHLQQVQEDQFDQLKELDVTLTFQVAHNYYFGDFHHQVIYGPERTARLNPARSALDRGLSVTIHHDSPVHPVDQFMLIWTAVNRVTRSGRVIGPEQRIGVLEALKASTINAAFQLFEEEEKGSLETGKLADMVILDRNPLTVDPMELKDVLIEETIKEGRTVFRAE